MNILITGATSGIGRQLAIDYQNQGHTVYGIGRSLEKLADLKQYGIITGAVDLTRREETFSWFGELDCVDIAILSAGSCEYIDMPNFDSALVSRVMRTNVESMANSIEAVLPLLRKSSSPHLVGVGSSAAYLPLPRAEAYGASKAAVGYLIDTLRITLAKENISVSLVSPGFVKTPLTDLNDFPMPFLISTEEASKAIRKGIDRKQAEIHFPKRFTYLLKALALLPRVLWSPIARRMVQ